MGTRLVVWGGYDQSKPRVRLLLNALKRVDAIEDEIAILVWDDVKDKSVAGRSKLARAALRWMAGLPRAMLRLFKSRPGCPILLPYPGTPEIFLIAPFAKLSGRTIVFDAFLPIHDTIVADRKMVRECGLTARLLRWFEGAGLRLADVNLVDTDAHGDFLAQSYGISRSKFITVLVGAETLFSRDHVEKRETRITEGDEQKTVLFYGQLIPLHGLATILAAIKSDALSDIRWVIVGRGQDETMLEVFMQSANPDKVSWIPWVEYNQLPALIDQADVCLGIFSGSGKAGRVLPNKLFQALAMGKPVITRQSAAVEGLARRFPNVLRTVPAEDPAALLKAVRDLLFDERARQPIPPEMIARLGPEEGVSNLLRYLDGEQARE